MGTEILSSVDKVATYPDPFFDLSNRRMPKSMTELYDWCIYYYLATPLIPAVINKLSTYPITDTIVESRNATSKKKWEKLLNQILNVKYKMFENNLDYFLLGRNITSIYIPFKRILVCKECKHETPMNGADWRVKFSKKKRKKNQKRVKGDLLPDFTFFCDVCQSIVPCDLKDNPSPDFSRVNIIRYSPRNIKRIKDPISGECKYLWEIPPRYIKIIKDGRHASFIENCPKEILEGINSDHRVMLSSDNVYEMARPGTTGEINESGTPLVIHALKWTYYLSVLQSAQEAIAHEKIVPFDILFPAPGGASSKTPGLTVSMKKFRQELEQGLADKRKDPGSKLIMPNAVGSIRLGGDARALMLAAEIDWVSKQIITSMGVPMEFVYGGLTWTGSSITLRMLENSMIGLRDNSELWLQWIVDKIASQFKLEAPKVRLSELKMADDVQRQQILMSLEAAEKIASSTLLDEMGFDFNDEADKILNEADTKAKLIINAAVTSAKAQGTAAIVQNNFMMRSQLIQGSQSAASGIDPATGYPVDESGVPVDPNTGFPIDPQIGLPMNPQTGEYINPDTGEVMSPEEVQEYAMQTNQQQGEAQNTANQPTQGDQGVPGAAVDNAIYSQREQQEDAQNSAAQQAVSYNMAPENLKVTVTNLAQQLVNADLFTKSQILNQLQGRSPQLKAMVEERMAMLMAGQV